MAQTDAFALPHSSLNTFLFAELGTELNGSHLTMLSALARLGFDPWTEATRWVGLPKAAVTDCVARIIAQMPLDTTALANARATAARLVLLLPVQIEKLSAKSRAVPVFAALKSRTIIFICGAVLFGLLANVLLMPGPAAIGPAATTQSVPGRSAPMTN